MRKIKFRAWIKNCKKMFRVSEIDFDFETVEALHHFQNFSDIELLQFTGLTDAQGKEIYEGDIIEIDGGGDSIVASVEFEDGCFVANSKVFSQSKPELKYYVGMAFCECRVIGNIYEQELDNEQENGGN